jgi:hypothetical protein
MDVREDDVQLPEFVLSDDSVNRYGFRVSTEGIQLDNFLKNPVMTVNHYYGDGGSGNIGHWEGLRKEGGRLIGRPVFDDTDPMAQRMKAKVLNGHVRAASIGFDPKKVSDAPGDLVQGQVRGTVTECELLEVALVDVPGNANAVRLSALWGGGGLDEKIPVINLGATPKSIKSMSELSKIAQSLGLPADATEEQVVQKIEGIKSKALEDTLSLGRSKGLVTAENEADYRTLGMAQPEALKAIVEKAAAKPEAKPEVTVTGILKTLSGMGGTPAADDRSQWSFDDWSRKDPDGLLQLKSTDNNRYVALARAYKPKV